MKKFSVLIGTLALALGFGVAVGAHSAKDVKVADASTNFSVYLEFSHEHWNYNSKVGLYMFDSDHSAWGHLEGRGESGNTHRYIKYTETLDFSPDKVIVVQVAPEVTELSGDIWDSESLWSRTNDIFVDDAIWVGDYTGGKYVGGGEYSIETSITGWDYESATAEVYDIGLFGSHITDGGDLEVYGDVSGMPKCQFKAVTYAGPGYYHTYTVQESIASNFRAGGINDNIVCEVAGNYQMYFNYTTKSLWIQMDANEEAKAYAESFLATVTCNGSAVTAPAGTWADMKDAYDGMSAGARGVLTNADADKAGTAVQQAVARYDLIVVKYGTTAYEDFMGRIDAGKLVAVSYGVSELETNSAAPIIIIVSAAVSLTAIGLVLVLRKKRNIK